MAALFELHTLDRGCPVLSGRLGVVGDEFSAPGAGQVQGVLVLAASGGLGMFLVQLARAAGARVIGATRGAAKFGVADHQR